MELNCPLLEGCSGLFCPGAEASITVPVWAAARGFWEHGPGAGGAQGWGVRAGQRGAPGGSGMRLRQPRGASGTWGACRACSRSRCAAAVLANGTAVTCFWPHDTLSKWEFFPFIPGKHCRHCYCQCISGSPWLRWFAQQKSIFQSF